MKQTSKKVLITKEGLDELQKEYDFLKKTKLPQIIERVSLAREAGDISENAEYQAAKTEQEFVETRIEELEKALGESKVIENNFSNGGIVQLGTSVLVEIDGKEKEEYTIVGSTEANPMKGKISSQSPVGQALIGAKVGGIVVVTTSSGKSNYKVIKVK